MKQNRRLKFKRHTNLQYGFLMFETIVYMAIFSICMMVFMRAIAHVMSSLHDAGRNAAHVVSVATALDLMGRDVWCAYDASISMHDSHTCSMKTQQGDIEWQWDNGTLYRRAKRKRNKVVTGITTYSCEYNESRGMLVVHADTACRVFSTTHGVIS